MKPSRRWFRLYGVVAICAAVALILAFNLVSRRAFDVQTVLYLLVGLVALRLVFTVFRERR